MSDPGARRERMTPFRPAQAEGLRQDLSEKSLDQGRNFLSALFMAVRTAQIHDPGNRAFAQAVDIVHRAAEVLFASTGGFSVQIVEDLAFLNGIRLRFESSAFPAMRTLCRILERHELGGITMRTPPSRGAIHRLIALFSASNTGDVPITKEDLAELSIDFLGLQKLSDRAAGVRVDRRVFAVQCYAKLVLTVREQLERLRLAAAGDRRPLEKPPRLRAVRVIQDLVELCKDRSDFLLRLSAHRHGAEPLELAGANACVLAIATGYALGFDRQSLVDLGVAGLFHHLDAGLGRTLPLDVSGAPIALAQLLSDGRVGTSSYIRALIVAERPTLDMRRPAPGEPHPFSRLLGVVAAYGQFTGGSGLEDALHPLDALTRLYNDEERFDRRLVDLLVNVLRAFPIGIEVVLDDGQRARVLTHGGGSRWDRPVVQVATPEGPFNLDLMVRREGRFERRIVGTRMFVEASAPRDRALPAASFARASPTDDGLCDLLTPLPSDGFPEELGLGVPPLEETVPGDPFLEQDPFADAVRDLWPLQGDPEP